MALETAQYIHQLEPANPAATDQLAQADDHLRLIKATIQATFPNIEGPVTASHTDLNNPFSLAVGFVGIWFGTAESVPSGWGIMNGGTYPRSDGSGDITLPDWRNLTLIGAGSTASLGQTVGATSSNANTGSAGGHSHTISGGAHSHGGSVAGHALTVAEIPSHKHLNGVVDKDGSLYNHGFEVANPTKGSSIDGNGSEGDCEGWTTSTGGGEAHSHGLQIESSTHSHTVSSASGHTHSVSVSTLQPSIGVHFICKI